MQTSTLAAGIVGFLLGGLIVSVACELQDDGAPDPHSIVERAEHATR